MARRWIWLAASGIALVACPVTVTTCGGSSVLDPGATGDTTSSTTPSSTSSGDTGVDDGATCAELAAEYLQQFEHARICAPELSVEQCTLALGHDLYCPCPRMVNPANEQAITRLEELQGEWDTNSCPPVLPTCDAGMCPDAGPSWCEPQPPGSSAAGLCTHP